MTKYKVDDYQMWVDKYIEISKEIASKIPSDKLSDYGLPYESWYVNNCYDESVTNWRSFLNWCGFPSVKYHPSKEVLAGYILEMRERFGKPMQIRDFNHKHGYHDVSISLIKSVWGTFNNMKEYVGLDSKLRIKNIGNLVGNKCGSIISCGCKSKTKGDIKLCELDEYLLRIIS